MINQKASKKEEAVVREVHAIRQKTIVSESASFTDIPWDKSKIEELQVSINAILVPQISAHPPILAQCKVHRLWAVFCEGTVLYFIFTTNFWDTKKFPSGAHPHTP